MNRIQKCLGFITTHSKQLVLASSIVFTGLAFVTTTGMASAAVGVTQFCASGGTSCLNAWNGGPEVNVYSPGFQNNHFNIITANDTRYVNIMYTGPSGLNGECIGDYGDDSTNARAGLVGGCGTSGIGWGGNFTKASCTSNGKSGFTFKNAHWPNGYLGPSGGNGAAFYLNKPTSWCFQNLVLSP